MLRSNSKQTGESAQSVVKAATSHDATFARNFDNCILADFRVFRGVNVTAIKRH